MARRPRGVCSNCGERRVLNGGLCQSCIEEEEFGQRQHEAFLKWREEQDKASSLPEID